MSWITEHAEKYSDDRNAYKNDGRGAYEFDLGHDDIKGAYINGSKEIMAEIIKIVDHMVSRDYRHDVIARIEELDK